MYQYWRTDDNLTMFAMLPSPRKFSVGKKTSVGNEVNVIGVSYYWFIQVLFALLLFFSLLFVFFVCFFVFCFFVTLYSQQSGVLTLLYISTVNAIPILISLK